MASVSSGVASDSQGFVCPDSEEVRSALERLLLSSQFADSPRATRFLRFVVEAALEGRGTEVKEYVLGEEVFDRGASFDPRIDTIVRVEAVKLRNRLRAYYRGAGRREHLLIEIPKGRYVAIFRTRASKKPRIARIQTAKPIAIAVIPFVSPGSDPDLEHWSNGLSQELISALPRSGEIQVVSRASALASGGRTADVREIGNVPGADAIVAGSVSQQDDRVRITAHMTRVSSGVEVWSRTVDCDANDVWAVRKEIARAILAGAQLEFFANGQSRKSERYKVHPLAFGKYLEARRLSLGCACWPLLGVAAPQVHLEHLPGPPRGFVKRAKSILRQALALDPDLAEAHALMGSLVARHEWNWPEAKQHFQKALSLMPWSAETHAVYAQDYLLPLGRFDEALAENQRARDLDCSAAHLVRGYVFILICQDRFEEAEFECRRILAMHGEDVLFRLHLAFVLQAQGRFKECPAQFELVRAANLSPENRAFPAFIQALSGDRRPAEELLRQLKKHSETEFIRGLSFAFLYLALGRTEEAIREVERAYRNQEHGLVICNVCHIFDSLRSDPRFQEIRRGFRAPAASDADSL
jgi:TolB-like protein/tetratricopeptide (TPR) repeat protein